MMKQKKKSFNTAYEVYICKDDLGTIIYIGSGLIGRHKHCTSGISNVYGLNDMHFKGNSVHVKIDGVFETKEKSLEREKELILKFKPKFNKQFLQTRNAEALNKGAIRVAKLRKIVKEICKKHYKTARNGPALNFIAYVETLINNFGVSGLMEGVYVTGILGFDSTCGIGNKYINNRASRPHQMFCDIFDKDKSSIRFRPEIVVALDS